MKDMDNPTQSAAQNEPAVVKYKTPEGTSIRTQFDPPPIPPRCFDWSAVTDNYEPGEPIGYGYTETEAVNDLLEKVEAGGA